MSWFVYALGAAILAAIVDGVWLQFRLWDDERDRD